MAKYKSIVVTNAGLELIAAAQSGDTIEFTAMKTGAGVYTGSEVLSESTGLKDLKQTFGVAGITRDETVIKVRSVIDNNGLDTGYNITEIGLFAKDKSGNEILYGVVVAETGFEDFLPSHSDAPTTITSEMHIDVSSIDSNVVFQATVIPGTYVTVEDFEDYKEQQNQYDNSFISSIEIKGKTITVKNKDGEVLYTGETQDTTYNLATTAKAGLMDSADKVKLNGIEEGAQKNTITGIKGSAESSYRTGDVNITKGNIGLGSVDNTSDTDKPVSTAQQEALDLKVDTADYELKIAALERADILNSQGTGNVSIMAQDTADQLNNHKNTRSNPHNVTKAQVGLGNVDNTADVDKPVSTAQREALSAHTDNVDIHITSAERNAWTNKAEHDEIFAENILPYPYAHTTRSEYGIEWVDLGNGTILAKSGTATDESIFNCRVRGDDNVIIDPNPLILDAGTYAISGCPAGGTSTTYRLRLGKTTNGEFEALLGEYGKGAKLTHTEETQIQVQLVIAKGTTIPDLYFTPMIEKGGVAHPYTEYVKSHTKLREDLDALNTVASSSANGLMSSADKNRLDNDVANRSEIIADNLLIYPYYDTTHSDNAITFTDLGDGTIDVSGGTATANCLFMFRHLTANETTPLVLPKGTYTISGGTAEIYIEVYSVVNNALGTLLARDRGKGYTFTISEDTQVICRISIAKDTVVTATRIKPMLVTGGVAHLYTEYRKSHAKMREDIDTLMEDTGWITLKANGTYTDETYGTEYMVDSPICYRIIRGQLWIKGNVTGYINQGEASVYVRLELPDDIVFPSTTVKTIGCDIQPIGNDENLFMFSKLNASESRILLSFHGTTYEGLLPVSTRFNENLLLD